MYLSALDRVDLAGTIEAKGRPGLTRRQTGGGRLEIESNLLSISSSIATENLVFRAPSFVLRDGDGVNQNNIFYETYLKTLVQTLGVSDLTFSAVDGVRSEVIEIGAIDFNNLLNTTGDGDSTGSDDQEPIDRVIQDLSVNLTLIGDRNGDGRGDILLTHGLGTAGGNLTLSGTTIQTNQLATPNYLDNSLPSGDIVIKAIGDLNITDIFTASFSDQGVSVDGGDVELTAGGTIQVEGSITTNAQTAQAENATDLLLVTRSGQGGNVRIEARGDLTIAQFVNTNASVVGTNAQSGNGGNIHLTTGGNLNLNVLLAGSTSVSTFDTAGKTGNGGDITLVAGGTIVASDLSSAVIADLSSDLLILNVPIESGASGAIRIQAGEELPSIPSMPIA